MSTISVYIHFHWYDTPYNQFQTHIVKTMNPRYRVYRDKESRWKKNDKATVIIINYHNLSIIIDILEWLGGALAPRANPKDRHKKYC